ncbi:SIR2 family protein [Burkholderia pseudomallei]|uniref:SIR2 family protein n=1 Tax=Burkholderia pseudomallei TaxID=28450 RepID=UPI0021F6BE13|nr:SIR2 family protein [Burkholderia pseudomallei]MCW0159670.1 SIR2 family protein [Burkholderia pseudomallei]
MPHYLLLGAGFSRNCGGWLSNEVTDDLVWRLRDHPEICEVLLQWGFEGALFDLRSRHARREIDAEPIQLLEAAISDSFRAMNMSFAAQRLQFEFGQEARSSITDFWARFDAIFTLNQDILLELHYDPTLTRRRWAGIQWPGVAPAGWPALTPAARAELADQRWHVLLGEDPVIDRDTQPVIKLHGSSNWYTDDEAGQHIVIGGQKREAIDASPLLRFYSRYFAECLVQRDALLMTIGYSFSDEHINEVICDANEAGANFGIFIVGPDGRSVLDKSHPDNLEYDPQLRLTRLRYIGGSSRLLSSSFRGDQLELDKLLRFFD